MRERKKTRTREALATAMLRLSSAHGFENVTIDQVAAEADVSCRTFFRYFPTKEAAMFPEYASRLEQFRTSLRIAPPAEPALATLERAFLSMAKVYMEERDAIVEQQRVVEGSPTLIAFERTLDRDWESSVAALLQSDEHERRDATHARVLAGAMMGAVRATLRAWFEGAGRSDLVALGRATFRQLFPPVRAKSVGRPARRRS